MIFLRLPFLKGVQCLSFDSTVVDSDRIHRHITSYLGSNDFVLYYNGKKLPEHHQVPYGATVLLAFSLPGGKGGFGSMLRAIGAQIEKTTNREACRDLSGRRLRDINEELRLKKWLAGRGEREAEKVRRRAERLKRLKSEPKHNFVDFEYEKAISELPDRIDDALAAGIQKKNKRPAQEAEASCSTAPPKKKSLWLDEDISGSSDSDSELSEATNSDSHEPTNLDTYCATTSKSDMMSDDQTRNDLQIEGSANSKTSDSSNFSDEIASDVAEKQILDEKSSVMDIESDSDVVIMHAGSSTSVEAVSESSSVDMKVDAPSSTVEVLNEDNSPVDLLMYNSVSELESLGLDRLKLALMTRGLKCGGNILDRAKRLWCVRGLQPEEYPSSLLAKKKK